MPKLEFVGYEVTSDTLDGKASTGRLKPGSTYGHVVRTSQYFQLRPIDITIDSTLIDTKQLEFDNAGVAWQWPLYLDSFTDEQEETRLLRCHFPKTRFRDTITMNVTGDDQGQLGLVLDIV
jgi:hypothetical protein